MLSLSSEDYFLEEADSHIQANLEDEVVQEALRSGVDLREYSAQLENELKDVENESIRDYIRESKNIASLHNQIVNCDQILEVGVRDPEINVIIVNFVLFFSAWRTCCCPSKATWAASALRSSPSNSSQSR